MATVTATEITKVSQAVAPVTADTSNTINGVNERTVIVIEHINSMGGNVTLEIPAQVSSIDILGHGELTVSNISLTVAVGEIHYVTAAPLDYASGGSMSLNVTMGTETDVAIYAVYPNVI